MNPIIFDFSEPDEKARLKPVPEQNRVSGGALKAAECLLKADGEGYLSREQRQILAEILDEIDFPSLIESRVNELKNQARVRSRALEELEKTARGNGWLKA
ncbi:MAG: hypothetical protein HPY50_20665 [Firmicutes bacterium]|nr:hypothetical protein [Bacillota bacterium]